MSSGSPITLNTWPSTPSPTGIVMPWPRLRTTAPRRSPSVGFRQMARTRLSPICCATSAVMVIVVALELGVHLDGHVDLGQAVGRELDVDDRSGDRDDAAVLQVLRTGGIGGHGHGAAPVVWLLRSSARARRRDRRRGLRWCRRGGLRGAVRPAQGFGAADDLHDLGGDRVLAGAVHAPGEAGDEVFGVVGRGLHRPLPGGVLRRRGVEQRGVARARRRSAGAGGRGCPRATARTRTRPRPSRRPRARCRPRSRRAPAASASGCSTICVPTDTKRGVDDLDHVDVAGEEQLRRRRADLPRVLVASDGREKPLNAASMR